MPAVAEAHLPEEPNSFIGREREIAEVCRMLRRTRALTLYGPGGIGKTRLALRILAATADEFPDGAWFVELADLRQPELVPSRVAAVIGVSEEPGRPLLDTLADALRPRRLLLALDNCEHLIDACAQLGQRLLASSPGLRLLSTSREPLRIAAETAWEVPPLSVAPADAQRVAKEAYKYEAIRLFADRAAASRRGFTVDPGNAADIAAICRALDGMPLAIELAAARVRVLSPEQINARMGDRFALLTAGDRSAPARQQTLRAAIEWSYELLAVPERMLFRRLSVLAGWSLEMAEQVCADEDIPAPERPRPARRAGGQVAGGARAGGAGPGALPDAGHHQGIRGSAPGRGRGVSQVPARTPRLRRADRGAERGDRDGAGPGLLVGPGGRPAPSTTSRPGNVIQVLTWCLAQADAETGLRICAAVSPCWIVWGTFAEGREWLDSFLALDASAVPAGSGARPRWRAPSSPCPAIAPRPRPWPGRGWSCAGRPAIEFWTAVGAEPAHRDRAAHRTDRGGGEHREPGAVDRAGCR